MSLDCKKRIGMEDKQLFIFRVTEKCKRRIWSSKYGKRY